VSDADWKLLSRKLKPLALERLCTHILDSVKTLALQPDKSAHERYRAVYQFIQSSDRDIGRAFDDLRRSSMDIQLAHMCRLNLITEEERRGFSAETQARLALFPGENNGEPLLETVTSESRTRRTARRNRSVRGGT
jgi:hypothetical protein